MQCKEKGENQLDCAETNETVCAPASEEMCAFTGVVVKPGTGARVGTEPVETVFAMKENPWGCFPDLPLGVEDGNPWEE